MYGLGFLIKMATILAILAFASGHLGAIPPKTLGAAAGDASGIKESDFELSSFPLVKQELCDAFQAIVFLYISFPESPQLRIAPGFPAI
jgi:hypothetical protein